jgi:hypothetical protein
MYAICLIAFVVGVAKKEMAGERGSWRLLPSLRPFASPPPGAIFKYVEAPCAD